MGLYLGGGDFIHFSDGGRRAHWSIGPVLYSADTGSLFNGGYKYPEAGLDLSGWDLRGVLPLAKDEVAGLPSQAAPPKGFSKTVTFVDQTPDPSAYVRLYRDARQAEVTHCYVGRHWQDVLGLRPSVQALVGLAGVGLVLDGPGTQSIGVDGTWPPSPDQPLALARVR